MGHESRRVLGLPSSHHLKINDIRLGEFDIGKVLYHANYFNLYERVREDFLKDHNHSYSSLVNNHGLHLAVVETTQTFRSPIFYGDEVDIYLTTTDIKSSLVTFNYQIKKSDEPIHTASTKHALVKETNEKGFQVVRFEKELRKTLEKIRA